MTKYNTKILIIIYFIQLTNIGNKQIYKTNKTCNSQQVKRPCDKLTV